MTGKEMQTVIDFEKSLKIGDEVRIRWTLCNRFFSGLGHVKKINAHSIIVTLSAIVSGQDLGGPDGSDYPAGRNINAPLMTMGSGGKLWSCNNRVEPTEGYK